LILTCERCETRFRLDESRLPAKGARVRCSRCKHAFLVRPPTATPAAVIDELAAEATERGAPSPIDATWDLDERTDPGQAAPPRTRRNEPAAPPSVEDESEWRFESEPPDLGPLGDVPHAESTTAAAELDPNESSFAQLGDPESWDLGASSEETPSAASSAAAASEARAPAPPARDAAPERRAPVVDDLERAEVPRIRAVEPEPHVRMAGIAATVVLGVLTLLGGLRGTPAPVRAADATVGSLAVEKLRVRVVDNAWAGPLWVVSGELHNPSGAPLRIDAAPTVVLLDASGAPIDGAAALAQPALDPTRLATEDPAVLDGQSAAAARTLVARASEPDARVAFDAILAHAPSRAARFALDTRPLPRPPAPTAPAEPAPPSP